jgi:FkbM family methyltransferase
MQIYYGIESNKINITKKVLDTCLINNIIYISTDIRVPLFGDPIVGTHKFIFINTASNVTLKYDDLTSVLFDTLTNTDLSNKLSPIDYVAKLAGLHSRLKLNHGPFYHEYPEQLMSTRFIKGDEKVLEIGGNIGRNSLIIGSLLNDSKNLVSLECDLRIADQLKENRDLNSLNFHIESSALSKRPLIQKGWDTIVSDTLLPGYSPVNTITYDKLLEKYGLDFDTLVVDCEGALYYILMDMPEILNGIKLIIMENDYRDIEHKRSVDTVFTKGGFECIYREAGGWGPCYDRFYEVWGKST